MRIMRLKNWWNPFRKIDKYKCTFCGWAGMHLPRATEVREGHRKAYHYCVPGNR